jgi:hypothetical protein
MYAGRNISGVFYGSCDGGFKYADTPISVDRLKEIMYEDG